MKVNKTDDALVCFNLLSLFGEVYFFLPFFFFFTQKHPMFTTPLGKWETANVNLC